MCPTRVFLFIVFLALADGFTPSLAAQEVTLVIHGGAGTITRAQLTPDEEKGFRSSLEAALLIGREVLRKGGTSLDAVEAVIRKLEDDPRFNAGKGAVFTHEGRNELDAAIMDGKELRAGAVTAVTILKNPISAARAVMDKSAHVMMTGRGAELFATSQGLEVVDPSYFWTERRWKQLQKELLKESTKKQAEGDRQDSGRAYFGTVGAVALDSHGNLAAGTSTGGMTNKKFGRVGDSPIIGAGTYANNRSCAVSATGHGEFFIRYGVAHDIAALVEYKGLSVKEASEEVIQRKLKRVGGEGGVIVLDAKGNFAMTFNSEGMYRGVIRGDGLPQVAIYRED